MFKCELCNLAFKLFTKLLTHVENVHEKSTQTIVKFPECVYCKISFKSREFLESHIENHHCTICGGQFFKKFANLNEHKKNIHEESKIDEVHEESKSSALVFQYKKRPYKCGFCEKTFYKNSHLQSHVNKDHTNGSRDLEIISVTKKGIKNNSKLSNSKRFVEIVHEENLKEKLTAEYECTQCGQTFQQNMQLTTHFVQNHISNKSRIKMQKLYQNVHKGPKRKNEDQTEFEIISVDELSITENLEKSKSVKLSLPTTSNLEEIPTFNLISNDELKTQDTINSAIENFEKSQDDSWKNKYVVIENPDYLKIKPAAGGNFGFRKPKRIKTELEHICDLCNQKFHSKFNLQKHIENIHTTQNIWQCKYCQTDFVSNEYLKIHMKKFHCKICGNFFQNLKLHMENVHEETNNIIQESIVSEKFQMICKVCNSSFESSKSLENHTETFHNITFRYICDICELTIYGKANLQMHNDKFHTGRRKICELCEKPVNNLQKHVDKFHNKEKENCDIYSG